MDLGTHGRLRARCGYPTRSRAAYPPPRLAVNLFICCFGRFGGLDWASCMLDGALRRLDWALWMPRGTWVQGPWERQKPKT